MRPGRRPGTFEIRVELAPDPVTGQRRWKSRTIVANQKQAARELARMLVEVGGLDLAESTGGTMSHLFGTWIKHLRARGRAESTLYGYQKKWATIAPYLGALPVVAVTPQRIDAAYDQLIAAGHGTGNIAHIHRTVRAMLGQAEAWQMIERNPAAFATPPDHHTPEPTAPEPDVVRALIDAARDESLAMACYLRLSATLGTRRGETLAIRWCDIGVDAIEVSAAMIDVPGQPMQRKATKTHATGAIPVGQATLAMLAELRAEVEERAEMFGVVLPADAYVFSDEPDGRRPWLPDHASKVMARVRARVPGGEQVSLKHLRAYVATRLVDADVDVRSAQARLRHRSSQTTQRHYTARRSAAEARAAQVLDDSLDG